jgi:iron-sulfur cluster assembly protein
MTLADEVRTQPDEVQSADPDSGTIAPSIVLTAGAAARVQRLLEERQLAGHALRVFISGGGCSGLQYGMALEGTPRESDHRFGFDGVDVVVDPVSMDYLAGATIDYVDDLMGGGFKIENPNAVSSCGCGHSFRTSRDGAAEGGSACGCH